MLALKRTEISRIASTDFAISIAEDFRLESGDRLPDAIIQLRRYGRADAEPIVVCGGISAGRDVAGADGWWRGLVAEGGAVDLHRHAVLGFDFAPLTDAHVRITPVDQGRLVRSALDTLGIGRLKGWIGASYGGIVGLSFAALAPERLRRLCVISAAHEPAPLAQAWRGVQRRVLEFAAAQGKPDEGLALARQLAMISYRSGEEFSERFAPGLDGEGRSALDRYLIARGHAYAQAMAPQRWRSLSEAIDRGLIDPTAVAAPLTLIASASDQLVPLSLVRDLAVRAPCVEAFHVIESPYGHDAFLKEDAQLAPLLRAFVERCDERA
jgi:homoserine O-acetyltransferase